MADREEGESEDRWRPDESSDVPSGRTGDRSRNDARSDYGRKRFRDERERTSQDLTDDGHGRGAARSDVREAEAERWSGDRERRGEGRREPRDHDRGRRASSSYGESRHERGDEPRRRPSPPGRAGQGSGDRDSDSRSGYDTGPGSRGGGGIYDSDRGRGYDSRPSDDARGGSSRPGGYAEGGQPRRRESGASYSQHQRSSSGSGDGAARAVGGAPRSGAGSGESRSAPPAPPSASASTGGSGLAPSMSALLAAARPPRVKLPASLRAELSLSLARPPAAAASDGAVRGEEESSGGGARGADEAASPGLPSEGAAAAPPRRRYESPPSEDEDSRRGGGRGSVAAAVAAASAVASSATAAAAPPSAFDGDLDDDVEGGGGDTAAAAALASAARSRAQQSTHALTHGCRRRGGGRRGGGAARGARYPSPSHRLPACVRACSVNAYRPLGKIDEGTYGVVFAAEDVETGERVALKKVKMPKLTDFPVTALRETNVLLSLNHENSAWCGGGDERPSTRMLGRAMLAVSFPCVLACSLACLPACLPPCAWLQSCASARWSSARASTKCTWAPSAFSSPPLLHQPSPLPPSCPQLHGHGLLRARRQAAHGDAAAELLAGASSCDGWEAHRRLVSPRPSPPQGEVKRLMLQLLRGVAHMHAAWVIHRDLKTSNLLYGPAGHLCSEPCPRPAAAAAAAAAG